MQKHIAVNIIKKQKFHFFAIVVGSAESGDGNIMDGNIIKIKFLNNIIIKPLLSKSTAVLLILFIKVSCYYFLLPFGRK